MRLSHVRWFAVAGLAAASEVLLVAVTIVYMIIYGNLNPGHAQDYYERHVRVAGPWISIPAGLPIFFVFARWLAKRARPGMAMVSSCPVGCLGSPGYDDRARRGRRSWYRADLAAVACILRQQVGERLDGRASG